jgi:hypothetical protein
VTTVLYTGKAVSDITVPLGLRPIYSTYDAKNYKNGKYTLAFNDIPADHTYCKKATVQEQVRHHIDLWPVLIPAFCSTYNQWTRLILTMASRFQYGRVASVVKSLKHPASLSTSSRFHPRLPVQSCKDTMAKKGTGTGKVMQWTYNPTSKKCETFTYSGAGGNRNNYNSLALCAAACETPIEVRIHSLQGRLSIVRIL